MSIFDLFSDPRESPFLRRAADGALGDDERQLYARRLAEWDPARAEWLRLEIALHARATPDPAERAAGTRRWRFGHVPLASPVVHPAAVRVIALLLDIGEDEVRALRDLESPDPSGPDELQGRLRGLDLEGEAERLAEARIQGRIRGSAQPLDRRAATIAALLAEGIRPEDTILHAIPVLPPDIDVTAHPRLGGVDRAEVERAYGRLLAANAEVARLVEGGAADADEPPDGSPLREARRALQRAADSLFGAFSSLPVHASTAPLGETHTPPFELPAGAVLTPSFSMGSAVFRAGRAFVLDDPAVGRPLLVTCLHLFGPAGGLPEQLSSRQVAWTISGATLLDAFEGIEMAESERAIEVPGARADEDVSDVAALLLPSPGHAARLHLSEQDVADGERVYLAAPVRAGAPLSQRLHPATVLARTASGSLLLELDVAVSTSRARAARRSSAPPAPWPACSSASGGAKRALSSSAP